MDHQVISLLLGILSTVLATGIVACIRYIAKLKKERKHENNKRQKAFENGMKCLLRSELFRYHEKYMKEGSIPKYAYENWIQMYDSYVGLDGNGMVVPMNEQIKSLPFR